MEFKYIVDKIDGDYAILKRTDNNDTILVALALLPSSIDIGTNILWCNFEYSIIE